MIQIMPFHEDVPRIVDRGKNNPKLGNRKWKRWPSSRAGYIDFRRESNPRRAGVVWAKIIPEGDGLVTIELHNQSSRPAQFILKGVEPDATVIELDGNQNYTVALPHTKAGIVTVYDSEANELAEWVENPVNYDSPPPTSHRPAVPPKPQWRS